MSDQLDGCELSFVADAIEDELIDLAVLFPEGMATPDLDAKAAEWRSLFNGQDHSSAT